MRAPVPLLSVIAPGLLLGLAPVTVVPAAEPVESSARLTLRASAVLHRWDEQRARAWARADGQALRDLYAPGSAAGQRDVTLLRAYADRGLRIERLTTQVLALRVERRRRGELVLRLVDRVVRAEVRGADGSVSRLPVTQPIERTVTLRSLGGRWVVAGVTPSG